MKYVVIIGALVLAFVGGVLLATDRDTAQAGVVELYTSENCVNCPAAEAEFDELGKSGAITLALHVDYQTLPALHDPYALEPALERQRRYAQISGQEMLFTPQFVVNGIPLPPGSDAAAVTEAMGSYKLTAFPITAVADDDAIRISWPVSHKAGDAWVFITEDNLANHSLYRDREKDAPHHRIVRHMEQLTEGGSEVRVLMDQAWEPEQLHATIVSHNDGRLTSAGTTRVAAN